MLVANSKMLRSTQLEVWILINYEWQWYWLNYKGIWWSKFIRAFAIDDIATIFLSFHASSLQQANHLVSQYSCVKILGRCRLLLPQFTCIYKCYFTLGYNMEKGYDQYWIVHQLFIFIELVWQLGSVTWEIFNLLKIVFVNFLGFQL